MKDTVTLTGMVLVASPMKDYDKRVELLTKERGRISAFAQGARKPNSALSACTIPFTFGEFQLHEGRNANNISSGVIKNYFGDLAQDYDSLCYASYFSEMARHLSRENIEAGEELMLLYMTFRAIQAGKVKMPLIRRIYEFRLMMLCGEGLEIFECLHCGREDAYDVYFSEGGLVCGECADKSGLKKKEYYQHISKDARYTLQYIATSSLQKLYSFNVSDNVMKELDKFMTRYLDRYLHHHFKSEGFLV